MVIRLRKRKQYNKKTRALVTQVIIYLAKFDPQSTPLFQDLLRVDVVLCAF